MAEQSNLIVLDDDYTIEPDAACWALHYRKVGDINPNTGSPTLSRDDTYYPNLEAALHAYIDKRLKTDTKTVAEILTRLDELKAHIKAVVSKYAGLFECATCSKEVHITSVKCPDCRGKK